MIIYDFRKNDLKKIITDKNQKKYFIKYDKDFIEVPLKVFRLYKADYMKTYRLYKKEQQLFKISYEEESMLGVHNLDVNKYYHEQICKKESIYNLHKAIKHLDKEQYYIIYSLFFEEKTESEVAKELNISQQALNKKKKKILLLLKKRLLKYQNV